MDIKGVDRDPLVAVGASLFVETGEWGAVHVVCTFVLPMALLTMVLLEFFLRPGSGGGVGGVPSVELGFNLAATLGVDFVAAIGPVNGEVGSGH